MKTLTLALAAASLAVLPNAATAQQVGSTGFNTGPDLTPGPSSNSQYRGMSDRNWSVLDLMSYEDRSRYRTFLTAQDYAGLIAFLETRARDEQVWAMHHLGLIYGSGKFVEADIVKSLNWYATAATRGDAQAALLLGSVYAKGEVVRADPGKAEYWLALAEEFGDYRIKRDVKRLRAEG